MKKLLVLIILLALAIFGSQFVKNNNSNSIIENNKGEDVVVFPEEETDDIFNEYYNDALKLMKDMTLEEKIGQLFLVRYDVNVMKLIVIDKKQNKLRIIMQEDLFCLLRIFKIILKRQLQRN